MAREMRKRKEKTMMSCSSENVAAQKIGDGDDGLPAGGKGGFFACYLLTSLSPRYKGHTYIGFTVNPKRRIRQHNGEIRCGAWRTKRKRPWEMVMCIYGFATNVSALQFEWAWQHPKESLAVRKAAAELKSLSGVANKIKIAYTMLTLPSWQSLVLTVNFLSTKYTTHCASCPSLPDHMKVQVQCMDELPCYDSSANRSFEDEHDVAADDEEVNYRTSGHDIMSEVTDPTRYSLSDDQSDRADENRTGSGFEKEKRLSSDTSDILTSTSYMDDHVDAGLFQLPTENGCSLDEERTLGAGAPSQQLPTDETDEFVLNEQPTWEAYAFTKQHTNSYDLHDSPVARRSASLSSAHGSVIYVEDFSACGRTKLPTGNKTTRARKVIPSTADIEVIDIMTPSPDCRVSLFGKNRRAPSVYPSVIDLTRSPNFIQL